MDLFYKRFPAALLSLYFIKTLILPTTMVDVGVLAVLACSAAFHEAWSHLKFVREVRQEMKILTDRVAAAEKADAEIRTYVTNQKLAQQMRGLGGR